MEEAEIRQIYSHSVKLSDTAKGIRIDVHVWANDMTTAVEQAFETYELARITAKDSNIPVAPVEVIAK